MNKVKLKIILTILFIISAISYIYMLAVVDPSNKSLRNALKPVPILILLILYCFECKKKINLLVVSMFVTIVIADIVANTMDKFFIGIIIYGIANLFLVKMVHAFLKKEVKKEIVKYFLLGVGLFAVIFVFVLDNMGDSYYPIIFYGLIMCLTFSVILLNYLLEMTKANGVLLTAYGIRVLSDLIYVAVTFNESNVYFDMLSLSIFIILNYVFYRAFVFMEYDSGNKISNIQLKK